MLSKLQPTAEQVRAELKRVLQSSDFAASHSISTFLRFVVEETLAGREDTIKGYTIAVRAFGRETSFDPQTDTLVRTHARRLRRALERYYLTEGANDRVRIDLKAGNYIPLFTSVCGSGNGGHAITEVKSGYSSCVDQPGNLGSIWALPFTEVNPSDSTHLLAISLVEAINEALSTYPTVKTFGGRYEHGNCLSAQCAEAGTPAYGLDGTVADHANGICVHIRLCQQPDKRIVWAHRFEMQCGEDLYEFEQNVASRCAAMIADDFGVLARTNMMDSLTLGARNPGPIDPTLAYLHFCHTMSQESCRRAVTSLHDALDDGAGATVTAMLADLMANLYLFRGAGESTLYKADELIQRTLALNPHHARVDAIRVKLCHGQFCPTYTKIAEQAIQRHPHHPTVLSTVGALLAFSGQWTYGLKLLNQAEQLSPHLPGWVRYAPFLYHYTHREYDEALLTTLTFNTPGLFWDSVLRAAVFGQLGIANGARTTWATQTRRLDFPLAELGARARRLFLLDDHVDHLLQGFEKAQAMITDENRSLQHSPQPLQEITPIPTPFRVIA